VTKGDRRIDGVRGEGAVWGWARKRGQVFGTEVVEVPPAGRFGEAPVHDVNLAQASDHDVLRLEVAVHHAAFVGMGNGFTGADEDADGAGEAPAFLLPKGEGEDLVEGASLDRFIVK
jgi:hypothetical protein